MKKNYLFVGCAMALFFSYAALAAADVVADPAISDVISQLFAFVVSVFKQDSSVPWFVKASAGVAVLVSAIKCSGLKGMWDWMGDYKAAVAPVLSIGLLFLGKLGAHETITLSSIVAALGAGVGAIAVHEILDMVRKIPGLNKYIAMFIDIVEGVLGGKTSANSDPSQSSSPQAS